MRKNDEIRRDAWQNKSFKIAKDQNSLQFIDNDNILYNFNADDVLADDWEFYKLACEKTTEALIIKELTDILRWVVKEMRETADGSVIIQLPLSVGKMLREVLIRAEKE